MKEKITINGLINLGLVFSLLFCLAFSCGDSGDRPYNISRTPIPYGGDDPGSVLITQTGVGAPYGARDPYACSNTRQPTSGAISETQATEYILCEDEKIVEDHLYLDENLRISLGGSVPDNVNVFLGGDIDPRSPVTPIRASLEMYVCSRVTSNAGRNCDLFTRKTTGACARTTHGDWKCRLYGSDLDLRSAKHDMPPPQ